MRNLIPVIIFLFILVIPTLSQITPKKHQALPTNDLWMEDYIEKSTSGQEMFDKVIDAGHAIYKPLADENEESLRINKNWEDPTVNANASRWYGSVTINMYGGLFRRPETTIEGFALVLCHELGHAYGGEPYIRVWSKLSAEGQADFIGSKECLHRIMASLNLKNYEEHATGFMKDTCAEKFEEPARQDLCVRSLIGGQSLGNLLATISEVVIPDYETPDPTIVEETLLTYPDTVQCRLDTYLQGTLQQDRPACWFKKEVTE